MRGTHARRVIIFVASGVDWETLDCIAMKSSNVHANIIFLFYLEVPEPQVSTFCDVCEASGNSGIVQSPGFGEQGYSNYQDCTITFRLEQPGPQRVIVTLVDFETESNYDFLYIGDNQTSSFSGSRNGESITGKYDLLRTKRIVSTISLTPYSLCIMSTIPCYTLLF